MAQYQGGWRCPNCGHFEPATKPTMAPEANAAGAGSAGAGSDVANVSASALPSAPPIQGAGGRPAPASAPAPDAAVTASRPAPRVASDIKPPSAAPRPAVQSQPAADVPPPEPPSARPLGLSMDAMSRPAEHAEPAVIRPQAGSQISPQPQPQPETASSDATPSAPATVTSVETVSFGDDIDHAVTTLGQPSTATPAPVRHHGRLMTILRVTIFLAVAAASAFSVYTFWQYDPLGWFKAPKATPTPTASAHPAITVLTPTPKTSATPKATAKPSPTATPAPTPSSTAISRDNQRKDDLGAYANSWSATRFNGYMPTQPQPINVHRNDPSKNAEYQIITSGNPGDLGQIYYRAGGRCNGQNITPGTSGTRYVALFMKLESQSDPYCVDVP